MKTILINPFDKTITEREYDGSLDAMYALLGVDYVEAVYCNDEGEALFSKPDDCLFVDESGLLKEFRAYFVIKGKPLCGNAMTVGCDSEGDTAEANVSLEEIQAAVTWATAEEILDLCRTRGY